MELAAAMATVPLPDAAVLAALLISAPPLLMPVPERVRALLIDCPYRSSAAPLVTEAAPVPSAEVLPSFSVPATILVTPVYVFAPERVRAPVLALVSVPVPEITPL